MRKSLLLIPVALAVAALVAGCGGSSSAKLGSGDVAIVGDQHITHASLDEIMGRAKKSYERQGQKFPAQGTASYQTIRDQAVSLLVQQTEFEEKAAAMGVTVTNAEVATRLKFLKKQYYGGSEKKYLADIKKQGYTDAQVRAEVIKPQLVSEKVQKQILKDVKVTDAEVHQYYTTHLSAYTQPPTRSVRYILVGKSKALAQSVYTQLKNGSAQTWCKLAKKYAKDASGQNCGKATFSQGQTVKVFDTAAFSSPANKVVKPFYDSTQYKAWFVIEPLGPVKAKSVTPEKQVAPAIKQTLLSAKQKTAVNDWTNGVKKSFCSGSKVKYQAGFSPSPDPCASTTTNATTTG